MQFRGLNSKNVCNFQIQMKLNPKNVCNFSIQMKLNAKNVCNFRIKKLPNPLFFVRIREFSGRIVFIRIYIR